jgi:glutamate synthase (NADPH/NADH) large chain
MTGGTAVILGRAGVNLGAGMSGGVAYVYRLSEARVNREALASGEISLGSLEIEDVNKLRALLEQHVALTGSPLGQQLLSNFEAEVSNFVRVLPRDYARVMEIQRNANAVGIDLDGEEVWTQILEVTGG